MERVRAFCHEYLDHARARPELYEVMFLFPPVLSAAPATGAEIPMATKAFSLPAAAVAEAVARGRFPSVDPVEAALVLWTAMHGAASVLRLGFGFDRATEERLAASVIEVVIRGLSGPA